MKIISVNISEQKIIDWKGKSVTTGIFKNSVDFPIFLDAENVQNDAICDREHHGGIDQAVYAYSEEKYAFWKPLYPNLEWQFGMFGENLTIDFLEESQLYVGDTFSVGETVLEVTKPRLPCMKLGVRFNNMKIVKHFWKENFPGVYFKVLKKGKVQVGDVFKPITNHEKNPTIADLYAKKRMEKGIL